MAQPLTISIPHQLGEAEARKRIDEGVGRLTEQFGGAQARFEKQWTDNRMNFSVGAMGQVISGVMTVVADAVHIEVVLPGLLNMMAGKIKATLQREGQLMLEKK